VDVNSSAFVSYLAQHVSGSAYAISCELNSDNTPNIVIELSILYFLSCTLFSVQ